MDDPDLTRDGRPRRRRRRARRAITPTAEMIAHAPHFDPVPSLTNRHDGWTYDRQRAFIQALAETGCVSRAVARIGMTEVGAYRIRKLPGAEGFARAWADAQAIGVEKLTDIAFERAIYGIPVPVFHKGEQVGEKRWYNDRLLMFTLRHHDPERYGGIGTNRVPPHVRRALRAEWEAEKAAEERERAATSETRAASARDWLEAKLAEMHKRLAPPDCPCCQPGYVEAEEEDEDPNDEDEGGDDPDGDGGPGGGGDGDARDGGAGAPPIPAAAPAPRHRTAEDIAADWHAWRIRTALRETRAAPPSADPRYEQDAAFAEWQALVDAGLVAAADPET